MTYKASWFRSPISIPECTSGKVSVSHRIIKPGEQVTIVGKRQALLRGVKPAVGLVKTPLTIHELRHEDHGLWMTDLPEELNQIAEMLYVVKPRGRILVGGLGLGILPLALMTEMRVGKITVVEIDPDVIKLCARPGYKVVNADLGEYLRMTNERFDFYLLDTWQGTNEGTWWNEVMPLHRTIRQRWGRRPMIHCWAEDIMLGQIMRTLSNTQPHWWYTGLPVPMATHVAQDFVRNVGLPSWEKKYGAIIDENTRTQKP